MSLYLIIGSANPVKRLGVTRACEDAGVRAEITFKEVSSGVGKQPFSLAEMASGAWNRASYARAEYLETRVQQYVPLPFPVLGVGVESGIFQIGQKYFDACYVVLSGGEKSYDALSAAFELPDALVAKLKESGELGDYFNKQGDGAIGALTKGRVNRVAQVAQATELALWRYLNKEF